MSRVPRFATLVVTAAVLTMIALGVWQLRRAGEKDRLLEVYSRAEGRPVLDLDPWIHREMPPASDFRRVMISCTPGPREPRLRGGRSADGQGGYHYFLPCRPNAAGWAGRLEINAGWSALPERGLRLALPSPVAGRLGTVRPEGPILLTSATAVGPLSPSAVPSMETIPNNHLAYAFQWFFFAAIALVVYLLALSRRLSAARQATKGARP
jgi:surfeit locus 1 family protein